MRTIGREAGAIKNPKYVLYIDFNANHDGERSLTKALEETNLLDAMRRVESLIRERGEEFYLVEILEKTNLKNEDGKPFYQSALMSRINPERISSVSWHFRSEENGESMTDWLYVWYETKGGFGNLIYCGKK